MDPKLTTEQEFQIEWKFRYEERIAIMCGTEEPTPKQIHIAKCEADDAIKELKKNHSRR